MEDKSTSVRPVYALPGIQLSLENISEIENMYRLEKELMSAIQQGDAQKAEEVIVSINLSEASASLMQRLPDQLRQSKNLAIVLNTLLRTAAKKGGLPVAYLHTISEKFALIIENSSSVEFINDQLSTAMVSEYANAVAMFSILNYSDLIKETIRYITSNITSDISLTTLGKQLNVNPSYLSRAFKEDTGMTLINYINHQRIELSKYYFETEMENITEVAFKVGYNDSGYFAKTFKKITGITPKSYINNLQNRRET